MACGDVLSLEDLQTAKKHQIFEAEVITGKAGGVAGGGAIDYATNQVTGQVQKTMPAILRDIGFEPASFDFTSGGALTTSDRNKAVLWPLSSGGDGDWYYWEGALPKVIPAASTPASNGGVAEGAWRPVGDITLRGEISDPNGATLYPELQQARWRDDGDVRGWGVVGDGIAIEHVQLQAAIDAVSAAGGGTIRIPANMMIKCAALVYGKKGVSIKCDPTSWLDFRGAGWLTPTNNLALFGYYGAAGAFIAPTADMVEGSNKIAVPSAAAFNVGDMIELSMNSNGRWEDTSVEVTAGQLAIVTGVFTGTNNITISEPLYETLTLANSARIRIIDPIENVTIDGLGIIGNGRNPSGNADQGLKIFFGRNSHIKNCRFKDVDTTSTAMISCYGGSIKDNRLDTQPLGTTGVISYGVAYMSSMHLEISGNHGINYRHGVVSSHMARADGYYGISRFIDVHDNIVTSNYGDLSSGGYPLAHSGISTHTDAEFIDIHNNDIVGCRYGINSRTGRNKISNNDIASCPVGVLLSEYWADTEISENTIINCSTPISTDSTPYEVARGVISVLDNSFDGCNGSSFTFPATVKSKLEFSDNTIRNPKNTGSSEAFNATGNLDLTAKDNDIDVRDTVAIRTAGTGYQQIESNNIRSLVPYNTNSSIFVSDATKFAVRGNAVTAPASSTNGNISAPTKLAAPNSTVSSNTYIEV